MNRNDIKIFKSKVMADTPNGGGSRTNIAVIDGKTNEVFPDISTIDYVSGDFSLRKVYVAVDTNTNEKMSDAYIYFTEPAESNFINVAMFKANSASETRKEALERVQSYFATGFGAMGVTAFNVGSPIITLTGVNVVHVKIGSNLLLTDGDEIQSAKVVAKSGDVVTLDHPVSSRLPTLAGGGIVTIVSGDVGSEFMNGVATVSEAITGGSLSAKVVNPKQRIKPLFDSVKTSSSSFKPAYLQG